jgi:serine/threonine-protein kinase RsbW
MAPRTAVQTEPRPHRKKTPERWHQETLRSTPEIAGVVAAVTGAMATAGYTDRDVFGMMLALEEALVNAVKHGNGNDPHKSVRVRYQVIGRRVLAEVEDDGPGFDPAQVPDPTAPENLDRPCGRGLLLMRSYMTWVRHNERGNGVSLCKELAPS